MKITMNPAAFIERERQPGDCGTISWSRLVESLRTAGEIKPNEVVTGIEIQPSGLKYVVEKK